jgi:hypothetical protein
MMEGAPMERALSGSMTRAEAPSSTLGFVYEFVVPSTAPLSQRGQMLACAKLSSPSERILCAYVDRGERSRPLRHLRPTDGHHYRPRSGNARVSACTYFPTPFQAICSRVVVSAGGPRRNWLTDWRARTSTTSQNLDEGAQPQGLDVPNDLLKLTVPCSTSRETST